MSWISEKVKKAIGKRTYYDIKNIVFGPSLPENDVTPPAEAEEKVKEEPRVTWMEIASLVTMGLVILYVVNRV